MDKRLPQRLDSGIGHLLVASLLSLGAPACVGGQTGESPIDPKQQPEAPTRPREPEDPMGGVQCYEDDECAGHLQGELDGLSRPADKRRDYADGLCGRGFVGEGFSSWGGDAGDPTCQCGDESYGVLLSDTTPGLCLFFARDRTCLYGADEFPGCDLEAPDSCDTICAELDRRIEADMARSHDVNLEAVACVANHCHGVIRIGDACYVDDSLSEHDCATPAAQVLDDMFANGPPPPEPVPNCDELPADAPGGGTCAEPPRERDNCYHPRDPAEWQGALVDVCTEIYCEGFCGLRLACVDNTCGPCERDDQCLQGEACVLDQCILEDHVECRSQADCDPGVVCLFMHEDDTPAEPRGNLGTWAVCNTQERLNDFRQMGDSE